jgi:hypothetical protein
MLPPARKHRSCGSLAAGRRRHHQLRWIRNDRMDTRTRGDIRMPSVIESAHAGGNLSPNCPPLRDQPLKYARLKIHALTHCRVRRPFRKVCPWLDLSKGLSSRDKFQHCSTVRRTVASVMRFLIRRRNFKSHRPGGVARHLAAIDSSPAAFGASSRPASSATDGRRASDGPHTPTIGSLSPSRRSHRTRWQRVWRTTR